MKTPWGCWWWITSREWLRASPLIPPAGIAIALGIVAQVRWQAFVAYGIACVALLVFPDRALAACSFVYRFQKTFESLPISQSGISLQENVDRRLAQLARALDFAYVSLNSFEEKISDWTPADAQVDPWIENEYQQRCERVDHCRKQFEQAQALARAAPFPLDVRNRYDDYLPKAEARTV